jgi:hypothetical protein
MMIRELPEDTDVVPLPVVGRIINDHLTVPWDRHLQRAAVRAGLIRPLPGITAAPTTGLTVDAAQARDIITAATMAETAQIPVIAALRVIQAYRANPELFAQAS